MTRLTRRAALAAAIIAIPAIAAADSAAEIEADVDHAMDRMFATVPGTKELAARARGVLIMPDVVKGGLIIGGSYGEGALKVAQRGADFRQNRRLGRGLTGLGRA